MDTRSEFLSTLPARGATASYTFNIPAQKFLSTLPARGATLQGLPGQAPHHISIHAPREGSDPAGQTESRYSSDFYPRSPRGERRCPATPTSNSKGFLSTLPARGATRGSRGRQCHLDGFLSTLPARGATEHKGEILAGKGISIHAPREGSDAKATCRPNTGYISIHAPREGSDV